MAILKKKAKASEPAAQASGASSVKEKPRKKVFRVLRIVKNVILGILMAGILCLFAVTLTAHFNGETPTLFGRTIYRVSSGSMEPYLQVGDIILCVECDPMELKTGEVITYNGKSGHLAGLRVTHRVVKEPYLNPDDGQYYLVTKGDDNPIEDTPITVSQVTGKMKYKIEWLKGLYDFFVTPWGLLTLIGLIVLAFFNEIINFVRALTGHDDDDEEHEDIQDIIARIQSESAEEEKKKQAAAESSGNGETPETPEESAGETE